MNESSFEQGLLALILATEGQPSGEGTHLDEFCVNSTYQHKHAIRLLNPPLPAAKVAPGRRVRGRADGSQASEVAR